MNEKCFNGFSEGEKKNIIEQVAFFRNIHSKKKQGEGI